jgi:hypothetical protein
MPLEPAELVLRMKEHRHYVGRTQIGLSVVLIELLPAKIDRSFFALCRELGFIVATVYYCFEGADFSHRLGRL